MDNYIKLVERISKSSNVDVSEIERKVEAKRAKLSGLVSKEGAAQIVAAELGVNLDQEKLKISELVQGMRKANFIGKIIEIYPIREFNKNGREGKVANLRVADDTGNLRVVLWDTNHIGLVEQEKIKQGDVIEVSNGSIRDSGEIHLGSFSDIKISKEEVKDVIEGKVFREGNLMDVRAGQGIKIRAVIMQSFEPRYFEVLKETGRKPSDEDRDSGKEIEKRALLNIVLDDGTETIRAVIFGDEIEKIGLTNEEIFDLEKFEKKKKEILGEEMIFQGSARNNSFSNSIELSIESISKIKPSDLIKELEAKIN